MQNEVAWFPVEVQMTKKRSETAKSKSSTRRKARPPVVPGPRAAVTPDERRRMIAECAYYRAERRGFRGGRPEEDWLEAEAEIDQMLIAVKKGA
jgi:hypothetical protein